MVRGILLLLLVTLFITWIWSINRNKNGRRRGQEPIPVGADIHQISNPLEAATALMIAVARMDTIGKVTPSQARLIAEELQTHMGIEAKDSFTIVKQIRDISRHLNRPQSMGLTMTKALTGRLTPAEISDLTGMMTRVAEREGSINRDQIEFISEIRDALENPILETGWHLAQINIAYFNAPKFNTANDDFHNAIDSVNAIAESSPGFVWRLIDDEEQRVGIDIFRDPDMIINMSVWEDMDSLSAFVYRDKDHRAVMRRKEEWFKDIEVYMVLWWVKAGETPTLKDAARRLDLLTSRGATDEAFTFKESFSSPDNPGENA